MRPSASAVIALLGVMVSVAPADEAAVIKKCLFDLKYLGPNARANAARRLGELYPAARVVPALVEALGDERNIVRTAAGAALLKIGPVVFRDVLKGVRGKDAMTSIVASRVLLGYSESMKTVEPYGNLLALALKQPEPEARANVAKMLLKAGPKNIKALIRTFVYEHPDALEAGARALAAVGKPAFPAVRERLGHSDSASSAAKQVRVEIRIILPPFTGRSPCNCGNIPRSPGMRPAGKWRHAA